MGLSIKDLSISIDTSLVSNSPHHELSLEQSAVLNSPVSLSVYVISDTVNKVHDTNRHKPPTL